MRDAEPGLEEGGPSPRDEEWKPHTHREQEDDFRPTGHCHWGVGSRRLKGAASPDKGQRGEDTERDEKQDEVDVPLVPDSRVSDQPVRVGVSAEEHDLKKRMHVVQTDGVPPNQGRIALAMRS